MTDIQLNVDSAALQLLRCLDATINGGIHHGRFNLYGIEVQVVFRLNPDAIKKLVRKADRLSMSPLFWDYPCELFGIPVRINSDGKSAPPISIGLEPTKDILGDVK